MNFLEFRHDYLNTLRTYLTLDEKKYLGMIYGKQGEALGNKLLDMEENHPSWVEIIEDQLAENHHLQG